MLKDIKDVLPTPLALGVVLWGAISYFVLGPNIATRVAKVDHLPVCKANLAINIEKVKREGVAAASASGADPAANMAIAQLRQLSDNPMMRALSQFGGFGGTMDAALAEAEAKQEQARKIHQAAVKEVNARAATHMAGRDGLCGCIADKVYDQGRNDWAAYVATLGTIKLPAVENFGEDIQRASARGVCLIEQEGRA